MKISQIRRFQSVIRLSYEEYAESVNHGFELRRVSNFHNEKTTYDTGSDSNHFISGLLSMNYVCKRIQSK